MARDLVIVESPTKARTIGQILGGQYVVRASLGHVRDLPTIRLGVDINGGFQPQYIVPPDRSKVVEELRGLVKEAALVYLATDPDREGEAISWHLAQVLGLAPAQLRRVVYHEITPEAVREAFRSPRGLDMALVNAQQARRVLDRLVGYRLSPLISKKLRFYPLTAGRVQSVALRLVVEREQEIQAFVPREWWTVEARLTPQARPDAAFIAHLQGIVDQKRMLTIPSQDAAQRLVQELEGAAYAVSQVIQQPLHLMPSPPFITSTLQQEAGRKLGFTAARTMQVAQQLYEGMDLGHGEAVGLITYMRTDSTHVAPSAQREARECIQKTFGREYLPPHPRAYRTKVRGAQEAHEAIRPTSALRAPEGVRAHLTSEQHRLYDLIWKRFLASQMADAQGTSTRVDIAARSPRSDKTYLFHATGFSLTFPGFRRLYQEGADDGQSLGSSEGALPPLSQDEALRCLGLEPHQHFTQPPPRYTEASLIKALEEKGIGRPSTYATIVTTIQGRGYAKRESGRLRPQLLGFAVSKLLTENFSEVVDLDFTARMEEELDEIAQGRGDWQQVLQDFYGPFSRDLAQAEERIPRTGVETGETCEVCGRPMVLKRSRRWGKVFLSCSGYPECTHARPLQERTGVACPRCKKGELVERRARRGKRRSTFYGCSTYPDCDFTVDRKPLPEPCPECSGLLVQQGRAKARCTSCDYQGPVPEKTLALAES